jgi:hypothetical protein
MATKTPTITNIGSQDGSVLKFEWTLTGTDDGAPMQFAEWADRSVAMAANHRRDNNTGHADRSPRAGQFGDFDNLLQAVGGLAE